VSGAFVLQRRLSHGRVVELHEGDYRAMQRSWSASLNGGSAPKLSGLIAHPLTEPFTGWLINEPPGDERGRGEYLLRADAYRNPLLLSAPHRTADRFTGRITLRLFMETGAAAAAWNSVPRRSALGGASDLARLERHPFTAFATAFAESFPDGRIVQLHGFEPARRTTEQARSASVILSNGSGSSSATLLTIAGCLRTRLPSDEVLVFPDDVKELGATRNAQGAALRRTHFQGFVHAELSLQFRERLMQDHHLLEEFGRCLESGL
jgi:hypothetical protein